MHDWVRNGCSDLARRSEFSVIRRAVNDDARTQTNLVVRRILKANVQEDEVLDCLCGIKQVGSHSASQRIIHHVGLHAPTLLAKSLERHVAPVEGAAPADDSFSHIQMPGHRDADSLEILPIDAGILQQTCAKLVKSLDCVFRRFGGIWHLDLRTEVTADVAQTRHDRRLAHLETKSLRLAAR